MADKNPTATATANAPEAKPAKVKRQPLQEVFDTPELAVQAAQSRTKGPRRAFKVTSPDGKQTFNVVHNNEGRAAGVAFLRMGGKVEELGGKTRKAKGPVGVEGILAAISELPEAERKAVADQLKLVLPPAKK